MAKRKHATLAEMLPEQHNTYVRHALSVPERVYTNVTDIAEDLGVPRTKVLELLLDFYLENRA